MRTLLGWLVVVSIVFFGVGEFAGGWYLGVAPQTPLLVYKKTTAKAVSRRTTMSTAFPFKVSGVLRSGTLTVQGIYERSGSFQNPGAASSPAQAYFVQTFPAGRPVRVDETLRRGAGIYTVRLIFRDATGRISVKVPNNSEL